MKIGAKHVNYVRMAIDNYHNGNRKNAIELITKHEITLKDFLEEEEYYYFETTDIIDFHNLIIESRFNIEVTLREELDNVKTILKEERNFFKRDN